MQAQTLARCPHQIITTRPSSYTTLIEICYLLSQLGVTVMILHKFDKDSAHSIKSERLQIP